MLLFDYPACSTFVVQALFAQHAPHILQTIRTYDILADVGEVRAVYLL